MFTRRPTPSNQYFRDGIVWLCNTIARRSPGLTFASLDERAKAADEVPPALHDRLGGVAFPAAVLERDFSGASVRREAPIERGPDPRIHVVTDARPADRFLGNDLIDPELHGNDRAALVELQLRFASGLLGDLAVLRPPAAISGRGGERIEDFLGAATDDDLLLDAAAHDRSSLVQISM